MLPRSHYAVKLSYNMGDFIQHYWEGLCRNQSAIGNYLCLEKCSGKNSGVSQAISALKGRFDFDSLGFAQGEPFGFTEKSKIVLNVAKSGMTSNSDQAHARKKFILILLSIGS